MKVRGAIIGFLLAAAGLGLGAGAVRAADSPERWRGTVEGRTNEALTIRPQAGDAAAGTVTLRLHPKTRVIAATPARLRDIKPESYVSVIAEPGPDGTRKPLRVAIYSASERGFLPGHHPWDLVPGATFTAGWIGELSIDAPRRIGLAYEGGSTVFTIPRDTPTMQITGGERSMLVPGAAVTVIGHTEADGLPAADRITVSRTVVVPPL